MRRITILSILMLSVGLVLVGCASRNEKRAGLNPFAGTGSPYYKGKGPVPWGGGRFHVGSPYQVAGNWFTPKEQPNYDKEGAASWYGEAFNRRMTSNGEWFDMTRLTAAHATLPLPSYVKVSNLENGREVVVRVNDRGPFVGTRIIDMSKRAAQALDFQGAGKAQVRVQYIGPAPLDDNGKHLIAMNNELERGTPPRRMIAAASKARGKVQVAAFVPKAQERIPEEEATPAIGDGYYVQVGSFANPDNAERTRAALASTWPVQVIETGDVYRVRLGPISGRSDADAALNDTIILGHADAYVVPAADVHAAL